MDARRSGRTYAVAFSDADARIFTQHTGVAEGVVVGAGEFVYDVRNGDLLDRRGAARFRDEPEWLAFSQDAQDFGATMLARAGNPVAVYEFASQMPELAHNPGDRKHAHIGRRVELIYTTDPSTILRPGDKGTVTMVDDANVLYVDWDNGETLGLMPGIDTFQFISNSNPDRISRTRGVKTMKGPYGRSKGYGPWIRHRGTLGEGFLTTMSKQQRESALDECVSQWGYRSCLGKIMALERARSGPRGRGEGVGTKYASKLRASREYLVATYGGAGSFGPRKRKRGTGRKAADRGNPYMGDAVELARYRKEREKWERGGRRGPPPVPPRQRHG